jgi:hypothetical protein
MGDPAGAKAPRRVPSLPEESKFLQRKSTGYNQKQQSMRKQPLIKIQKAASKFEAASSIS